MTTTQRTGRAALIAALLGTTAAHADVTAQDVWNDWKTNMAAAGDGVFSSGDESMNGDTLTVSDVSMTVVEEDTTVTAGFGTMTFTELGDGTVRVAMADTVPITVDVAPEFGDPATFNVSLVQDSADLVVSGTPEEMNYALTAASYTIRLDSVEGDTDGTLLNDIHFTMTGVDGSYVSSTGNLRNVSYDVSVDGLAMVVDVAEDGGPGMVRFDGSIEGLDVTAAAALPLEMDMEMPETAFADGLSFEAGYSFGPVSYAFNFTEGSDAMEGSASVASGSMEIAMDSEAFSYGGGAQDVQISFVGGDVPFPVDLSLAEYGYGLSLPLAASEEPEEFGLRVLLSELAVNDAVWGMIDPNFMLSHQPATLSIDITGLVRLLVDVTDPAQMENAMMSDDLPGELHALDINELVLRIAGAELTGDGSFTFDNSDLETFGGVPAPRGSATLNLTGANQLIDSLVEMGLLPEDLVMGARMMMGMFMNAVGDDQLQSTLEVNDQNHVIVNGQRIQ